VLDVMKSEECVFFESIERNGFAYCVIHIFFAFFLQGDGCEHGCEAYDDKDDCQVGDALWIRSCQSRGTEFNVLQEPKSDGYLLRLDNRNLCLSRVENQKVMVKECDMDDKEQLWAPWADFSKFELRPHDEIGLTEREADCVSQLHHPKDEELLSVSKCSCKDYINLYGFDCKFSHISCLSLSHRQI
jgi:hypothetical protein